MASLGRDSITTNLQADVIKCRKIQIEHPDQPAGDPHKIVGDVEITGNLDLKVKPSFTDVNITMDVTTESWDVSVSALDSTFIISRDTPGDISGDIVASFAKVPGGGYGSVFPAHYFKLEGLPTTQPAQPGFVWSDGGILKIS